MHSRISIDHLEKDSLVESQFQAVRFIKKCSLVTNTEFRKFEFHKNLTKPLHKGFQNGADMILLLTNHVTDVVSIINNFPNQNVSKSLNTTRDGCKYSYYHRYSLPSLLIMHLL